MKGVSGVASRRRDDMNRFREFVRAVVLCAAGSAVGGAAMAAAPPKCPSAASLPGTWVCIDLPLKAWGYRSVEPLSSVVVRRDAKGAFVATAAVPRRAEVSAMPLLRSRTELPFRAFDFGRDVEGPLRNRFGTFAGRGGSAVLARRRDRPAPTLVIQTRASEEGSYAGAWFELAPAAGPRGEDVLDVADAVAVVLRGHGTPRGVVAIHDLESARRDAAVMLGSLEKAELAPDGSWSWSAAIPEGVDRQSLRSVVLDLTGIASADVEIGDIWVTGRETSLPPRPAAVEAKRKPVSRGLWVWNTSELLTDDEPLHAAVATWRITDVFLQLPDDGVNRGAWAEGATARRLAQLNERLHARGIKVHALDGAAVMALPRSRRAVVAQVRRVVRFTREVGKAGGFDAVHLDIEPYTLPEFGGRRRRELLRSYVATIAAARRAASPLPLWADVPFWYDEADEIDTGDASTERRSILESIVRSVDGIVVMDYRTVADGANGIARHAMSEVAMAHRWDKQVWIGVETVPLPAEDQWHVALDASPEFSAGAPAAFLVSGDRSILFTPSWEASASLQDVKGMRPLRVKHVKGADPRGVTFHGATPEHIERVTAEALELLTAAGHAPDGIALHELRTLPAAVPATDPHP